MEQEEKKEEVQEMQACLQREWRSAETRRSAETQQSPRDEDDQEEEELSFTLEEKDNLYLRREEKHRDEEEQKMPDKVTFPIIPLLLSLLAGTITITCTFCLEET